jgi:hypothetical protein
MRAAAILGLGCSSQQLKPFQADKAQFGQQIECRIGMPASSADADVVLLFGGDGTIHRHLSQLVKLGLPVLVVPAGSGNDFARALGLQSVRDSLAAWKKFCADADNVRAIDLGVITPWHQGIADSPLGDRHRVSQLVTWDWHLATSAALPASVSTPKSHDAPISCRDGCAGMAAMR